MASLDKSGKGITVVTNVTSEALAETRGIVTFTASTTFKAVVI